MESYTDFLSEAETRGFDCTGTGFYFYLVARSTPIEKYSMVKLSWRDIYRETGLSQNKAAAYLSKFETAKLCTFTDTQSSRQKRWSKAKKSITLIGPPKLPFKNKEKILLLLKKWGENRHKGRLITPLDIGFYLVIKNLCLIPLAEGGRLVNFSFDEVKKITKLDIKTVISSSLRLEKQKMLKFIKGDRALKKKSTFITYEI